MLLISHFHKLRKRITLVLKYMLKIFISRDHRKKKNICIVNIIFISGMENRIEKIYYNDNKY